CNGAHCGIGLLKTHSILQSCDRTDVSHIAASRTDGILAGGKPQVRVFQKTESARHDANNPKRRTSNRQRFRENSRIAAEPALPHVVAQDDNMIAAGPVFGRCEHPPDLRMYAENSEKVC